MVADINNTELFKRLNELISEFEHDSVKYFELVSQLKDVNSNSDFDLILNQLDVNRWETYWLMSEIEELLNMASSEIPESELNELKGIFLKMIQKYYIYFLKLQLDALQSAISH